jgi:hypothetical protein
MLITLSRDFTRFPFGRYRRDHQHSGEEFREDVLAPKLKAAVDAGSVLTVLLDVQGSAAFFDEAFSKLKLHGFDHKTCERHLRIVSNRPHYAVLARRYLSGELPMVSA